MLGAMKSVRRCLVLVGALLLSGCSSDDDDEGAANGGCQEETGVLAGITSAHNAVRAAVSEGDPLPQLVWSCEIAAVAQAYADELARSGCSLQHSSNGYGENLYWSSNASEPE